MALLTQIAEDLQFCKSRAKSLYRLTPTERAQLPRCDLAPKVAVDESRSKEEELQSLKYQLYEAQAVNKELYEFCLNHMTKKK